MAEFISKEIAIQTIIDNFTSYFPNVTDAVRKIPAADVQPIRRGKWDFIGHQLFKCTNCTKIYTQKQLEDMGENWAFPDFCPKCGADMRNDSNLMETEGKVLAVGLGSSFKDSLIKTEIEGLFLNFEQEE